MNNNFFVTIILPIRNESQFIKSTLDSIVNQDYKKNKIEIIIVDGMSNDGTREIISDFKNRHGNIKIIDNPERIVPTAFNYALNEASGEIIIRLDGHTIIAPNYITRCVDLLDQRKASNVGGLMIADSEDLIGRLVSIATSSRFGIGNSFFHYSKVGRWVNTVYLGAWMRKVFEDIGGFDEELVRNQDDEFNFRLIQNGGRIWLDPSIKSIYKPRNSILKLFKQYFQYGFYRIRVIQKRRNFSSWRQIVPGSFVFFLIFSLIFINNNSIPFLCVSISYCTANFLATLVCIFKLKRFSISSFIGSIVFLPVIFFIIHFSYGAGFLLGLVYFSSSWSDTIIKDGHFELDRFINNTKKMGQ